MPSCRSCQAPIRFVTKDPSSMPIPIDVEPDDARGNILIDSTSGRALVCKNHAKAREVDPTAPTYISHFVTCSDADTYRGKRRRRKA